MIAENDPSAATVEARVTENMPLARYLAVGAWRNIHKAYPLDDLMGYAYVGLCKAARLFNPARAKFSTYATQQIKWAISDGMRAMDHLSRTQRAASRTEDNPAFRQISLHTAVTTSEYTGESFCVGYVLTDPKAADPSDTAHTTCTLSELLSHLHEPRRSMFVARHLRHMTNTQIARLFDVSESTVSQTNKASLLFLQSLARKRAALCAMAAAGEPL